MDAARSIPVAAGTVFPTRCCQLLWTTSSTKLTASVTGVHDFKVNSFPLLEGMGVGKCVSSNTFAVGGHDWALCFYPDGATASCDGNTSAFLSYRGHDDTRRVWARFTLTLLQRDGNGKDVAQATNSSRELLHTFSLAKDHRGFLKFVDKSRLRQPGSTYLDCDDCLTIRCVLTVVTKSYTVDGEINLVPPSNLHTDMARMLRDGEGADVEFTVDGQSFSAHRCVLASRSPVFRAQLFGPMRECVSKSIQIDNMEPSIFKALLHFIYTDRLPCSCSDSRNAAVLQHLLVAADRFGIERLRLVCESKLVEAVDVETVVTTLVLAEQHNCSQLRRACIGFMASPKAFGPVLGNDEFKCLIANSPSIMEEIFDKVSRLWSNHQFS